MRALTLALLACAVSVPALAATPAKAPAFTGMWLLESRDFGKDRKMPLTEAALKIQADRRKAVEAGDVIGQGGKSCAPAGVPTIMANEFASEWLESPGRVTIVNEASPLVRSIYLKPKHTEGLEPSWNGHSIGHWEGKGMSRTLVIDTINFNDKAELFGFVGVHSSTTHLVERYRLEGDSDHMVGELTFTDPRYLTGPYVAKIHYKRLPVDAELWEYACETGGGWQERFKGDTGGK